MTYSWNGPVFAFSGKRFLWYFGEMPRRPFSNGKKVNLRTWKNLTLDPELPHHHGKVLGSWKLDLPKIWALYPKVDFAIFSVELDPELPHHHGKVLGSWKHYLPKRWELYPKVVFAISSTITRKMMQNLTHSFLIIAGRSWLLKHFMYFLERLGRGGGGRLGRGEGMPSGATSVWPGRSRASPASLTNKNYKKHNFPVSLTSPGPLLAPGGTIMGAVFVMAIPTIPRREANSV